MSTFVTFSTLIWIFCFGVAREEIFPFLVWQHAKRRKKESIVILFLGFQTLTDNRCVVLKDGKEQLNRYLERLYGDGTKFEIVGWQETSVVIGENIATTTTLQIFFPD